MKKKNKMPLFSKIVFVILCLYTIMLFVPAIWGLFTSLKDKWEMRENIWGLPQQWLFSNYLTVLQKFSVEVESTGVYVTRQVDVLEMLFNSLYYAIGLSAVSTFITAVVAYATARYKYKFSKFIYVLVVFTMILPIIGALPSELQVARNFGLYDSLTGIIIMKSYFFGMYFLILHATFSGIPRDYTEAAQIDGAGAYTTMFRVIFPFARSAFGAIFLLKFIGYWNDYQTPLLFAPNQPTLAYGLYHFANEFHDNEIKTVPMQLAACFAMAIPIFALYLATQKKLMGNISMGGIKG